MRGHGRGMAQDVEARAYDSRLMKRLIRYAAPYRWLMLLAFILLVASSAVEIVMPYLVKIGIDRYIVFNYRQLDISKLSAEKLRSLSGVILEVDSLTAIVKPDKLDPVDAARWEKSGILSSERYLVIDPSKSDNPSLVDSIIALNHDVFMSAISDGRRHYIVSRDNLKKLPEGDLRLIRSSDIEGVLHLGILYFILLIFSFLVSFGRIYSMQLIGQNVIKDIRGDVFAHIQRLSLSFFDKNPIGRLVTRTTNDVNVLNEMFATVLVSVFRDILMFFGITGLLFYMNWRLALIIWATMPFVVLATLLFRVKVRKAYRLVRKRLAEINSTLSEYLSGIRIIQLFTRERENIRRFVQLNRRYYKANMKQLFIASFFRPIVAVIRVVGIGLIIWYGGGDVIRVIMPLGALVAFLTYLDYFYRPIQSIAQQYDTLQAAMASSERIFHILDTKPALPSPENGYKRSPKGEIEFKNVWFTYDDNPDGEPEWILKDVSFKVRAGERIALVGPTGAGKTTVTSLIPRFYDVARGEILMDGVDVRKWDLPLLRRSIGIVLQDVFIFATDILGNIRLNEDAMDDDAVRRVAEYVNAHHFIEKLPAGYKERMQEQGATLSTGQKQLISFARALAFDPKILILDEATANIDTETEKLIQDALQKLIAKRTSIIVAHRLSTIKNVDRILVVLGGQIVEEGTHQELLKKRGVYYNLYQLQYKGRV